MAASSFQPGTIRPLREDGRNLSNLYKCTLEELVNSARIATLSDLSFDTPQWLTRLKAALLRKHSTPISDEMIKEIDQSMYDMTKARKDLGIPEPEDQS